MGTPREWKRLRTGEVTDYRILRIREDVVGDPRGGVERPRAIIEAPDWVHIIPVTLSDEVVLVRQFRFGIWSNSLEIPGGVVEAGEDPKAAAVRELEEETGYVPGRVLALGAIHPNPAILTNTCHTFLALGCEKTGQIDPDADEDIQLVLEPRRRIPELISTRAITHALVLCAFLLERLWWERQTSYEPERP
ncbi:MAG TPA: NUDIX hydrolase [Myxococcaceae bacterium]|nr:NUDIX hydrolase [Myxococcaceae bacterium]